MAGKPRLPGHSQGTAGLVAARQPWAEWCNLFGIPVFAANPPLWPIFGQNHPFDHLIGYFYTRYDVIASRQDVIASRQSVSASRQDVMVSRQSASVSRHDVLVSRQSVSVSPQDVLGWRQNVSRYRSKVAGFRRSVDGSNPGKPSQIILLAEAGW